MSNDNMATVVVNYDGASTAVPQVTNIGTLTYNVSVTPSISTGLKAEVRIKPDASTMQALQNDSYSYRMYYLDTSTNEWKLADYTDVNLDDGYVWGVTEHFSDYAIKDTSTRDSDGDGLTDMYEVNVYGTNPPKVVRTAPPSEKDSSQHLSTPPLLRPS